MSRVVSSFLIFLFLSGPAPVVATEDPPPNLTGTWVLSAESRSRLQAPRTSGERPGGGRSGRGSGGKSGAGRGGGRRGGSRPDAAPQQDTLGSAQHTQLLQKVERLQIFHDGIELNITDGLDISRLLYTDGRPLKIWTQQGETAATAMWQGQALIVSWESSQSGSGRLRRYLLSADGLRLTVTERRGDADSDKSPEMQLVYEKRD